MIKSHNYYIDILKSFNSFLFKVFDSESLGTKAIQNIEYNIGSKTLLKHKLYGNESFNYPTAIVDLQDIRGSEGVSTISRNVDGLIPSCESALLSDNLNKDENIYIETQRYILNLNVQINVESNADMFNFYHIVTNNIPINFTFVDYSYYYFIDVTEFVSDWDFTKDDIFNVIKMPDQTERDKTKYFSLLTAQPQLEVQSISKTEDKENNRYSIVFSVLLATQIPIKIYSNFKTRIDRIVIDIDNSNDYPILMDTFDKYSRVKKGIILNKSDFKTIQIESEESEESNESETSDDQNICYKYRLEIDDDLSDSLLSLYFNPDILNPEAPITFLTLDEPSIDIKYDQDQKKTIIDISNPEYNIIEKYFTEQYIENLGLIQLFIN